MSGWNLPDGVSDWDIDRHAPGDANGEAEDRAPVCCAIAEHMRIGKELRPVYCGSLAVHTKCADRSCRMEICKEHVMHCEECGDTYHPQCLPSEGKRICKDCRSEAAALNSHVSEWFREALNGFFRGAA
jgi:hypothetical protein